MRDLDALHLCADRLELMFDRHEKGPEEAKEQEEECKLKEKFLSFDFDELCYCEDLFYLVFSLTLIYGPLHVIYYLLFCLFKINLKNTHTCISMIDTKSSWISGWSKW